MRRIKTERQLQIRRPVPRFRFSRKFQLRRSCNLCLRLSQTPATSLVPLNQSCPLIRPWPHRLPRLHPLPPRHSRQPRIRQRHTPWLTRPVLPRRSPASTTRSPRPVRAPIRLLRQHLCLPPRERPNPLWRRLRQFTWKHRPIPVPNRLPLRPPRWYLLPPIMARPRRQPRCRRRQQWRSSVPPIRIRFRCLLWETSQSSPSAAVRNDNNPHPRLPSPHRLLPLLQPLPTRRRPWLLRPHQLLPNRRALWLLPWPPRPMIFRLYRNQGTESLTRPRRPSHYHRRQMTCRRFRPPGKRLPVPPRDRRLCNRPRELYPPSSRPGEPPPLQYPYPRHLPTRPFQQQPPIRPRPPRIRGHRRLQTSSQRASLRRLQFAPPSPPAQASLPCPAPPLGNQENHFPRPHHRPHSRCRKH